MSSASLKGIKTRKGTVSTPQTVKADERQVKNAAGGYTFKIEDLERAKRFLILGAESNYYKPGAKMAKENSKTLIKLAEQDDSSKSLVDLIVEYSTEGRAPSQDPGLFALAIASSYGSTESKRYALSKLSAVARTGSTLFSFVSFALQFRGWGRGLKTAIANWYLEKKGEQVAFQAVKYRSREGWTHRDLFQVAHVTTGAVSGDPQLAAVRAWVSEDKVSEESPRIIQGFIKAQEPGANVPALVREYSLSWEMLPTESLNDREVWEAILDSNLPLGALIRQLPRLTRLGMFQSMKEGSRTLEVSRRLMDRNEIERSRIHPIKVLEALKTYSLGHSLKGSSTWTPVRAITDALDKAFYLAFKNIEPSGKKFLIGLDVSGSMDWNYGTPEGVFTPREATGALALMITASEPDAHVIGFTGGSNRYYGARPASQAGKGLYGSSVSDLDNIVSSNRRLDDVIKDLKKLPMGSTDCALPMLYALENGLRPEVFVIMTDNETYAGSIQPHEALEKYRRATGIDAKLIVLAVTPTRNSIINPDDVNSLDVAGFDSAVPSLISSFARGDF